MAAGWDEGLAGAVQGVFVAPSRNGAVLCVGADAWPADFATLGPLLERLSAKFGRAFWFAARGASSEFGWAIAAGGRLERAYAMDGEHEVVLLDEGDRTAAESGLGFFADDPRDRTEDAIRWWPRPVDVFALAARLGVPVDFDRGPGADGARGLLGRF